MRNFRSATHSSSSDSPPLIDLQNVSKVYQMGDFELYALRSVSRTIRADGSRIYVSSGSVNAGGVGTGWVAVGSLPNTGVVDLPVREVGAGVMDDEAAGETAPTTSPTTARNETNSEPADNETLPTAEQNDSRDDFMKLKLRFTLR